MIRPIPIHKKIRSVMAIRWTGQNAADVLAFTGVAGRMSLASEDALFIQTPHGEVVCLIGDWVAKQYINGHPDVWPIASEVFDDTYEVGE